MEGLEEEIEEELAEKQIEHCDIKIITASSVEEEPEDENVVDDTKYDIFVKLNSEL